MNNPVTAGKQTSNQTKQTSSILENKNVVKTFDIE